MTKFSDLGIKAPESNTVFVGEKIATRKIFDREIKVHHYDIKPSKYKDKENGPEKCLYLQIELNGQKKLVMNSSLKLMQQIEQIPKEKFPVTTTIVEREDGSYLFT